MLMQKTSWRTSQALPGQISLWLSVLSLLGPKEAAPRRLWICLTEGWLPSLE